MSFVRVDRDEVGDEPTGSNDPGYSSSRLLSEIPRNGFGAAVGYCFFPTYLARCYVRRSDTLNACFFIADIKKEFDKKYGPTFHCIVGRNFGSYVTHEAKHFIYFYLGQVAILLFKSG